MSFLSALSSQRLTRWHWSSLVWVALAPAGLACSASDDGGPARRVGAGAAPADDFFVPAPNTGGTGGGSVPSPGQGDGMGFVETPPPGSGQVDVEDACVINTAAAEFV